jgi:hypothetical protein
MEPLTIDSKTLEFNLLREIMNNKHQLPVDFCLKYFLDWPDSTIKLFIKEQRKIEKALLKKYKKMQEESGILSSSCCGNTCQG